MNRIYAALLAFLLPSALCMAEGLERIQAWEKVEAYKIESRINTQRYSRWAHEPGNENRSRAEADAALGLKTPDPAPAVEAALRIAQANPTDDLGFMALQFAFFTARSMEGAQRQSASATVLALLEEHYLHDPRLDRLLLSLARAGGDKGLALLDKVVAASSRRELRARAAFWSAQERLMAVDDLRIPADERARVRAEVTRMARLVADEYGDVVVFGGQPGAEAIKPTLYALEHLAIGSRLPDASGQRIGGGEDFLSQYRGKVLLLDFWATWCVPCVASLPKVVKLKEALGDHSFEVITLSIDKELKTAQTFMTKRMQMPFVNWHIGAQSELYRDWGIKGVPTYILLDEQGIVRGRSHDVGSLQQAIVDLTGAGNEVAAALHQDKSAQADEASRN